jgi:hypothetical protein
MKIKMKDAGESPEFGPYEAGAEVDETRASVETLRRLVDRGDATEIIFNSALRTPKSALKEKEE